MKLAALAAMALTVATACATGGSVFQRFPDDVQTAFAHDDMRRLETERFILYYAARRRGEINRFLARAGRCVDQLREAALVKDGPSNDKMVVVMPDAPFNNAFVMSELGGYEAVAVIPTVNTFDFATEFGLVPDPGYIACHELTHYVHLEQITGFWKHLNQLFGHLYSPQNGFDPWFLEGLATHYEAKLSPGVGRPTWPIFTGMFAAAYAGKRLNGGDMSELGRLAPVGHQYLVGAMFMRFMTERYGEPAVWKSIADQASALTGVLFAGALHAGFGVTFGTLFDQFEAWHQQTFPVRPRPAAQRRLARLGDDARYARGRDGTEAWIANDVDVPPRFVVRAPDGKVLIELNMIDVIPPRTLVEADPQLVSGLSVTADGSEVWVTEIDQASTFQVPRLLRWRRGESKLTAMADDLGPGATIDPTGATYYYCAVDGDRWSLAAWDVRTHARRTLIEMVPGTYVLAAQIAPDGKQLAVDVWDGHAFVIWLVDAATGQRVGELSGGSPSAPLWDPSYTDDGRVMYLGELAGRFQIFVDGKPIGDAPYAVLDARAAGGTVRFLNREGWAWTLDEIALPQAVPADAPADALAPAAEAAPGEPDPVPQASLADEPYHAWEHFFVPQLHSLTFVDISNDLPLVGLVFGGGDRLGLQRWSIAGYGQESSLSNKIHWGGDVEYINNMLAPWQILASADAIDWVDSATISQASGPDMSVTDERRTRDASLSIARTFRGSLTTTLSGQYTDNYDHAIGTPSLHQRLGGPSFAVDFLSAETTPYTGLRRGIFADASIGYYPSDLSTFNGEIYDVRGDLGAVIPLPFGRRNLLYAELRGRALLAHDDTGLLQLGGASDFMSQLSTDSNGNPPQFDTTRFPPNLAFVEELRGYEDYSITTDRAAIADVWWHYPLIIDRGFAASFGSLPSTFFSELDFELFATGAIDRAHELHAALGGSLTAQLALFRLPLSLTYQLARRVRDDNALTNLFGLSVPLSIGAF